MRYSSRLIVGVTTAVGLVALGLSPTPAQAAPAPARSSVTGIDEATFTPAVIPAGTARNTLRIRWVAPRDVVNGSVSVILPLHDWQTPLQPEPGINVASYPAIVLGAVIVRPSALLGIETSPAGCSWTGKQPAVVRADVLHGWLLTADDVTCAAGQHLDFRVVNVRAPNRPGTYRIGWRSSGADPSGSLHNDFGNLPVRVVPTPDVTLHVGVPNPVSHGATVPVRVTATRNGVVATDYRGGVSLYSLGGSCEDVDGVALTHKFTAEDAGTAVIDVKIMAARRLVARDLAHRAVPGRSNWIRFDDPPLDGGSCPTSYH